MEQRLWKWWPLALAGILACGVVFRLIWVDDMEYKYDECWTFTQTQEGCRRETTLWLGIHNSTGYRCPGMSLWVFMALARVFDAHDPTTLARAVQLCNVAALLLVVLFALRCVPRPERETWLWAAALGAVNPLTVVFHRKIWPPSILPIFTVVLLIGWWYRERRLGAFFWGLMAVVLAQIHASGFFLAAGFFLWALCFDRRRVSWLAWLTGSCAGGFPLLPWFWHLLTTAREPTNSHATWKHVVEGKFWLRWLTEPFGLGLNYSLFTDFRDFLRFPLVVGTPTYLIGLLHLFVITALVVFLIRGGYFLWERLRRGSSLRDLWIGRHSPTAFTQNAALWGFGILLTLSALSLHRHYMVILFPLEFIWVARLALGNLTEETPARRLRLGRGLLAALCITQLLITAQFLGYIHEHRGCPRGDYGIAYSGQNPFRYLKPVDYLAAPVSNQR